MAGDQLAKDELEKLSHETGKPINLLVNDLANGEALPVKPLKRPYKDYRKAVKGRRGRKPMTDAEKAARKGKAAAEKKLAKAKAASLALPNRSKPTTSTK